MLFLLFSVTVFANVTLEQKLDRHWEKYGEARARLLERIDQADLPLSQRIVSREEWEKILRPERAYRLKAKDFRLLRKSQALRIRRAKERAIYDSRINLDSLRRLPGLVREAKIREFCVAIPKGGMLHIHPFGTFDRDTVNRLVTEKNPVVSVADWLNGILNSGGNAILYPSEVSWLRGLGPSPIYSSLSPEAQARVQDFLFLPPGKQSFPRFNAVFHFLGLAVATSEDYESALFDFADRAVSQGVSYVEFTGGFSPQVDAVLNKIEQRNGLVIRVNKSFNRTRTLMDLEAATKALLDLPSQERLVGIDFLDNEEGNSALDKGQVPYGLVLKAFQSGTTKLRRTMHAGELGDARNPRDAFILGADRIGHGVKLAHDLVALEYAAQNRIPVEVNISSNLRLTEVQSVKEHSFLDYLRLGLPVSLSTDDEGIFDTDIARECELAVKESDVSYEELKRMAFNGIETSFAKEPLRAKLSAELAAAFRQFEARWEKP